MLDRNVVSDTKADQTADTYNGTNAPRNRECLERSNGHDVVERKAQWLAVIKTEAEKQVRHPNWNGPASSLERSCSALT